jgi:hypothetical protein
LSLLQDLNFAHLPGAEEVNGVQWRERGKFLVRRREVLASPVTNEITYHYFVSHVHLVLRSKSESPFAQKHLETTPSLPLDSVVWSGSVMSLILPAERSECVRETFCYQSLFFQSEQAASPFLSDHPEAVLLSVEEAALVGRWVAQSRFTEKPEEKSG